MDHRLFGEDERQAKLGRLEDDDLEGQGGSSKYRMTTLRLKISWRELPPISTRPVMDKGQVIGAKRVHATTFHLSFRGVRATGKAAASIGRKAARHQLYVEREISGERFDSEEERAEAVLRRRDKEGHLVEDERGAISFGSPELGETPAERAQFWRSAARFERDLGVRNPDRKEKVEVPAPAEEANAARRPGRRAGGRRNSGAFVQLRVIGELPHFAPPDVQRRIVESWCAREFGTRGMPYWVAVHQPDVDKGSDPRNVHVHVNVGPRRVVRLCPGQWSFAATKIREVRGRVYPWGTEAPGGRLRRLRARSATGVVGRGRWGHSRALTARERERIDAQVAQVLGYIEVRSREGGDGADRKPAAVDWVRRLRASFADTVNAELKELARLGWPIERLYDPRSYADAGVAKMPTKHLGPKQTYPKRRGLETKLGRANQEIEAEAITQRFVRPFAEVIERSGRCVDALNSLRERADKAQIERDKLFETEALSELRKPVEVELADIARSISYSDGCINIRDKRGGPIDLKFNSSGNRLAPAQMQKRISSVMNGLIKYANGKLAKAEEHLRPYAEKVDSIEQMVRGIEAGRLADRHGRSVTAGTLATGLLVADATRQAHDLQARKRTLEIEREARTRALDEALAPVLGRPEFRDRARHIAVQWADVKALRWSTDRSETQSLQIALETLVEKPKKKGTGILARLRQLVRPDPSSLVDPTEGIARAAAALVSLDSELHEARLNFIDSAIKRADDVVRATTAEVTEIEGLLFSSSEGDAEARRRGIQVGYARSEFLKSRARVFAKLFAQSAQDQERPRPGDTQQSNAAVRANEPQRARDAEGKSQIKAADSATEKNPSSRVVPSPVAKPQPDVQRPRHRDDRSRPSSER